MGYAGPADRALMRLEVRRFVSRCENNAGLLQRADSLRELARLASAQVPYKIVNEIEARDAERRLLLATEDRAKEVIRGQIGHFVKADADHRVGLKSKMLEEWGNLTGPLAHLRTWAKGKLTLAEQSI
jgi:hypothetical protein